MQVIVTHPLRVILDLGTPGAADKSFLYLYTRENTYVVVKGPTTVENRNYLKDRSFVMIGELRRYISEGIPRVHSLDDLITLVFPKTSVNRDFSKA